MRPNIWTSFGFQGGGHVTVPKNAMDPKQANNFIACNQANGQDLGLQGVGQGIDLINAMDPIKGNNVITCNQAYVPDLRFQAA